MGGRGEGGSRTSPYEGDGGGDSRPTLDPSILPAATDLRCGEGGHETRLQGMGKSGWKGLGLWGMVSVQARI